MYIIPYRQLDLFYSMLVIRRYNTRWVYSTKKS